MVLSVLNPKRWVMTGWPNAYSLSASGRIEAVRLSRRIRKPAE
jgi:hypothetical protein